MTFSSYGAQNEIKMIKLKGKIILVDDDSYEKELLESALKKRGWDTRVEYFHDAHDALDHLKQNKEEIFLVISDMNMPKMNGMDFKKSIDSDPKLRAKSIPFIFATSSSVKSEITDAFDSVNHIQQKSRQTCLTL